jgi:hypothetical protein
VIADPSTTQDFAIAARGLAELGDPQASVGVLRLLAMTHPDWLESMGHALTRAFKGEVPNDLDPMIAGPEGGPSSDMQRYEG